MRCISYRQKEHQAESYSGNRLGLLWQKDAVSRRSEFGYRYSLFATWNIFVHETDVIILMSVIALGTLCVVHAQSQRPTRTSFSAERVTEEATNPAAPDGGHG